MDIGTASLGLGAIGAVAAGVITHRTLDATEAHDAAHGTTRSEIVRGSGAATLLVGTGAGMIAMMKGQSVLHHAAPMSGAKAAAMTGAGALVLGASIGVGLGMASQGISQLFSDLKWNERETLAQ